MMKTVKQTEIKETDIQYKTKDIEGTDFLKWWAIKVIKINGEIESEKKYCGVCLKSIFESIDTCDFPSSDISFNFLANTLWSVKAIKKSDMQEILKGNKYLDSYNVLKEVNSENIDSDEYELYLYGVYYSQLLTLDKKVVYVPIPLNVANQTALGKRYNWSYVLSEFENIFNGQRDSICQVVAIVKKKSNYGGAMVYFNLPTESYLKYQSLKNCVSRLDFILQDVMGLNRK